MPDAPIPTVLAMLLCDQVITDAESGKKTLVGTFDSMHPPKVPFLWAREMTVYARLADAEGKYVFKCEMVYLDEDKPVISAETAEITAPDRLRFVDLVMRIPAIPVEKYGTYEFQLYANGVFIGRSTMLVQEKRK